LRKAIKLGPDELDGRSSARRNGGELDGMTTKPIAIASDHGGFSLKRHIVATLIADGVACEDLGTHDAASCDYPDFQVSSGRYELHPFCGTGIGMAMAANRHAAYGRRS
jgi:hypothetical protein